MWEGARCLPEDGGRLFAEDGMKDLLRGSSIDGIPNL